MRNKLWSSQKQKIRWRLWQEQKGECAYCSVRVIQPNQKNQNDPRRATLDHIIPLSRGGSNDKENFVMACQGCNYELGDKDET